MDLTSFMQSSVKKELYKIIFFQGCTKVTRYISATSKENATHLLEQDLKKEGIKAEKIKIELLKGQTK